MATLSEAYKNNPIDLHHIIPLDFNSIHELPDSHIWTDRINSQQYRDLCIPIIDLNAPNVVELVGNACETWGMFHVINHGISSSLVDDVESHARRLFSLPTQDKLKALRPPNGATGYGVARISPFFAKSLWHEGFTMMGSPIGHARELWPDSYEEFCNVMENYQKKIKPLAYKIMLLILKYLTEEEEETISTPYMNDTEGALQLNSYPCCPDPDHTIGLAPHTDTHLLTILHQSETKGLEVHRNGIGWVPVSPVSGALVVNVGDLFHILSNGRFPSAYHRAIPDRNSHRISIAYFHAPPVDSIAEPLCKLPFQRYRSVTVREYVSLKHKHLEKALSFIRT